MAASPSSDNDHIKSDNTYLLIALREADPVAFWKTIQSYIEIHGLTLNQRRLISEAVQEALKM